MLNVFRDTNEFAKSLCIGAELLLTATMYGGKYTQLFVNPGLQRRVHGDERQLVVHRNPAGSRDHYE